MINTIEVFADVVCPFTHVGLRRLIERRRQLGATEVLVVRAWPLEMINGEPLAGALVAEEIQALRRAVAPDLFKHFNPTHLPMSSLPAMTLAAAAYRRDPGLGEHVSLALRDALFEQGRDIGDAEELAEIAGEYELDPPGEVDRSTIAADWKEGQRRGVLGSPHFFVGSDGYFCPALDIERVGGHLQIAASGTGFDQLVERAFSTGTTVRRRESA